MNAVKLPPSPLPGLSTVELGPSSEALLQDFFDANPAYFLAVTGAPAGAEEARIEINDQPPKGWSFTKKWMIGYLDDTEQLAAMACVVTDMLVTGVWHIGLFIVATSRHGSGLAHMLHQGLQDWAISHGARWLRLGVVQGNARAERFWESLGYVQTRTREGIEMGGRVNTIRVMVKPVGGGTIEEYLSLIPRDRPELENTL